MICAEGLSALLQKNEVVGLIHGCQVARRAPSVSRLFFADDAYIFFCATPDESAVVKGVLDTYKAASGQAINYSKSSIIFSTNENEQFQSEVSIMF